MKKPFTSSKSFHNHIQQSPECKAFVFEQSATTTTASSLQVPPKQTSIDSSSHLFKKQRLRLNPTFSQPEVSNNVYPHGIKDDSAYIYWLMLRQTIYAEQIILSALLLDVILWGIVTQNASGRVIHSM
jgi:hypothetical protein